MSGETFATMFGDADVDAHLSDRALVAHCLEVEVALTEAQHALGLVPPSALETIRQAARADEYDLAALSREAARDGIIVIPLVRALRARVDALAPAHARHVHRGATSQDILDTATVLQLGAAVPVLLASLRRAAATASRLATAHASTVMVGRTWLQHATPVTFGLIAAGWTDALDRAVIGITEALERASVVQLGGATGTLAALGAAGPQIVDDMAKRLGLRVPALPWHTHRDRLVSFGCTLAVAVGTLGKIGRDLALLTQTDVGEIVLTHEGGGSSTMPHKHNPVGPAAMLAASTRAPGLLAALVGAMPQELQRGVGGWQAEWAVLPELVSVAGGAARSAADTLEAVVVDSARMRANLQLTAGVALAEPVSLALAEHLGRQQAHDLVAAASQRALSERRSLASVLAEDPAVSRVLDRSALETLTDPDAYLGAASTFIARVVDRATGR